jgi:hypothetical protein
VPREPGEPRERTVSSGDRFRTRRKLQTVDIIPSPGFPIKLEGSMIFVGLAVRRRFTSEP